MRSSTLFAIPLGMLLGLMLLVIYKDHSALLHLFLCASAALLILYVSRTRAEYLWIGILGGLALILNPLSPMQSESSSLWPDVVCVVVFIVYYKLCIAGSRMSIRSGSGRPQQQPKA